MFLFKSLLDNIFVGFGETVYRHVIENSHGDQLSTTYCGALSVLKRITIYRYNVGKKTLPNNIWLKKLITPPDIWTLFWLQTSI